MRRFMLTLIVVLLMVITISAAPAPVRRILIINSQSGTPYEPVQVAMLEELAAQGYSEANKTLEIKVYNMAGNIDFAKRIQTEEGAGIDKYDVIIANGTLAVNGIKPLWLGDVKKKIIFANITDPIGAGVIEDFKNPPKNNFTGVAYPVPVRERLRLIMKVLPGVKKIGYVYSDMPQSLSYLKWLTDALAEPEFKGLSLVSVIIPFVTGDNGPTRMCMLAQTEAAKIDKNVDMFLAPNDQMGANMEYAKQLSAVITKPLVGLSDAEVINHLGAFMSIFSSMPKNGKRIAQMVKLLFDGKTIKDIVPEQAVYDIVFDKALVDKLKILVPAEYRDKLK